MYHLEWKIPEIVLHIKYWDILSLSDLMAAMTILKEDYLDHSAEPIHLILDLSELKVFPKRMPDLHKAMGIIAGHSNMGWVIIVGFLNPVLNFIASLLTQIYNVHLTSEPDMERALATLRRIDTRLL
ncbi:hypothetical protein G4Y79_23730 [Phototrophicus methaneseepsis]|uniref:STAS domain-containing protein n=1 Tax=Phototrophicus methaneseepsis TaxID=2710758 RepID=A0A7S8E941_9CHLR|nr:hypothetical protein [Phototrophicus methaneseepsis]QPC82661.1 hypothetical protein G4Y79_23730 [Phototrophicus methaneseepsis]